MSSQAVFNLIIPVELPGFVEDDIKIPPPERQSWPAQIRCHHEVVTSELSLPSPDAHGAPEYSAAESNQHSLADTKGCRLAYFGTNCAEEADLLTVTRLRLSLWMQVFNQNRPDLNVAAYARKDRSSSPLTNPSVGYPNVAFKVLHGSKTT